MASASKRPQSSADGRRGGRRRASPLSFPRQSCNARCDCASSRREAALLEHHFDLIAEFTEDGHFVWVSPGYSRILGHDSRDIVGQNGWSHVHPEDLPRVPDLASLRRGGTAPHVMRLRHRDGTWRCFEGVAVDYRTAEGELRRIGIARDITEQQRIELELRQSEERYRRLTENGAALVCEIDAQGRILYANRRYRDALGLDPDKLVGRSAWELIPEEDRALLVSSFTEALCTGKDGFRRYRALHRDGGVRWLEGSLVCHQGDNGQLRLITVSHDVTREKELQDDRERLEAQIQRIHRLDSLGVMAGGIAHDFNNLLVAILGHAELALDDLEKGTPAFDALQSIVTAAERAAELTRQMLAFAGKARLTRTWIDLDEVVRETMELLRARTPAQITLRCECAGDGQPILADRSQIGQIVLNLAVNAIEAMGPASGSLRIATGSVESGKAYRPIGRVTGELASGPYRFLRVSDTGSGMEGRVAERVFEPFFTTKFAGRGLGMASVLGIVRAHDGVIDMATEPGEGTQFTVLLPSGGPLQTEQAERVEEACGWWSS